MRRTCAWRSLVALSLFSILLTGRARATAMHHSPLRQPTHLYVMFLPGLCGWPHSDPYCYGHVNANARAQATFDTLRRAMVTAGIQYTPLSYSYDVHGATTYTVADTHQAIARSVTALDVELRAVWTRDPTAQFALVGHSLGGVVAASWAVNHRSPPPAGLLTAVHSIVTFDSPLKGIQSRYTNLGIVQLLGQVFTGPVWSSLQPTGVTIRQITSFRDPWWRSAGHLHSIANRADKLVPAPEALLGDQRLVSDSICGRDLIVVRSCHGAVLADSALNRWVACHWIGAADQCVVRPSPTPTPLPPTVTPVAPTTPSPTPTVTSLPGPGTATPTAVMTPEPGA